MICRQIKVWKFWPNISYDIVKCRCYIMILNCCHYKKFLQVHALYYVKLYSWSVYIHVYNRKSTFMRVVHFQLSKKPRIFILMKTQYCIIVDLIYYTFNNLIYLHFIRNARLKSIRSSEWYFPITARPNHLWCRNMRTIFSVAI